MGPSSPYCKHTLYPLKKSPLMFQLKEENEGNTLWLGLVASAKDSSFKGEKFLEIIFVIFLMSKGY